MNPTPKQQEAIDAASSVAVTAGAGTGKTAMLAARFVHHVVNEGLSPIQVAAVTFTDKAAAELRSRIRKELTTAIGEDRAAEIDAAQISTIHSLASRICRDFYDVCNIAPDFQMLDETDAAILGAAWYDEIIRSADDKIIAELDYTWMWETIAELRTDPQSALTALWFSPEQYQNMIFQARYKAITELRRSECWKEAEQVLKTPGHPDDKLEPYRAAVFSSLCDIENEKNIPEAVERILSAKINVGSAGNWPDGSLARVKECIKSLRTAVGEKGAFTNICLEWGEVEQEMYMRACKLRHVFEYIQQDLHLRKRERAVMDFADLEEYALQALESPATRGHYAERWKAILVDEFQDTNPVQEKLLEHLSEGRAKLTIVGDGKQSIYGFRRADPRVFERFRRRIDNDVVLDKTFRTHVGLVTPMNAIFDGLLGEAHDPLEADRISHPHDGPFIEAHSFSDDNFDIGHMRVVEGRYIAGEIQRLIAQQVKIWDRSTHEHRLVRPGDIAVLSRKGAPIDIYIEQLLSEGIPAVNTGGGYLLETQVALDLIMLLRFCSNTSDDVALVALLRGPFFAVDDVTLYQASRQKEKDESWWNLLVRVAAGHQELERPASVLTNLLKAAGNQPAVELVQLADQLTGYTAVIANLRQGDRRLADWFGFISLLRKFANLGRSDVFGVDRYLKDVLAAESKVPRPPVEAGDAVSLMTIHAAKGLEWPIVFVTNLSAAGRGDSGNICFDVEMGVGFKVTMKQPDGKYATKLPAMLKLIRAKKRKDEEAESARILYVAMTRARDRLYLTSAGKDSNDFLSLVPCLDAAEVEIHRHDATYQPELITKVVKANAQTVAAVDQLQSVTPQFETIPVTGLVDYSICPRRFKYRHVDGHPGLGEGASTNARLIGTLTHTALELGKYTVAELAPFADGSSNEILEEAIALAKVFRDGESFSSFQLGEFKREVPFRFEFGGAVLSGKADLVGEDFVIDFKTDSVELPKDHAVQLWAYAEAVGKSRAIVAYLRHSRSYVYSAEELAEAKLAAEHAVDGISNGRFNSTPTEAGCAVCSYGLICSERHSSTGLIPA